MRQFVMGTQPVLISVWAPGGQSSSLCMSPSGCQTRSLKRAHVRLHKRDGSHLSCLFVSQSLAGLGIAIFQGLEQNKANIGSHSWVSATNCENCNTERYTPFNAQKQTQSVPQHV